MNEEKAIPFRKMNGLGNDFVVLDARSRSIPMNAEIARAIGDRESGVGCDQVIVLRPVNGADVFMEIWNRGGSRVAACGNATRCVADILMRETGRDHAVIRTDAGLLLATRRKDGLIQVDMGAPRFHWQDIPLAEEFRDTRGIELQVGPIDNPVLHTPSVVNVGNPHAIFWVDDLEVVDLSRVGPLLENHPIFPEGANISLCKVESPEHLRLKVWERDAGLTKACGTAACAAAVCAARKRLAGRDVRVTLPGGNLFIRWRESDDHVLMAGPVEYEYEGTLPPETFARPAA
jgi:diaminopimelate epimerase